MKLRSALAIFGLTLASIAVKAQAIAPGVYNTAAGDYPVSIKFNEAGNLLYKDYRETVEYVKKDGKYVHPRYPQNYIKANGANGLINGEENSAFKKEFKLYAPANAKPANGVIAFTFNGDTYYAKQTNDPKFAGMYKYNGKEPRFFKYEQGEPIVFLGENHEGEYQNHGVPARPVQWWIESDPKGNFQVTKGELADRYLVVVKFTGGDGYPAVGEYQRMTLDVYKDGSKTAIMGERIKEK